MFIKKISHSRVTIKARELYGILSLALKGQLVNGPYIAEFEAEFAKYIGIEFSLAVASGRLGLRLILESLELNKGDEIIMPAYTFYAVCETIEKCGFRPVLVDINESDCNIDMSLIEGKVTDKTRAIIATHLYGSPCELSKILEIARKHNLFVIEDSAQAIGAQYRDKKVGSYGDCSFFSFESVKPFHTFGGGMITTNNPLLYEKLKSQIDKLPIPRYFDIAKKIIFTIIEVFLTHPFFFSIFVYPVLSAVSFLNKDLKILAKKTKSKFKILEAKYSNFQAYIGLQKLRNLEDALNKRIANAKLLISGLKPGIYPWEHPPYLKPIFYYLVLRNRNASSAVKILLGKGIDADLNLVQKCTASLSEEDYPVTYRVSKTTLLIPVYPELNSMEIKYISETINRNFGDEI